MLRREGDRGDGGPPTGGADRQLAPAGADLEHPAAVPDVGGVEEGVDLAELGLVEVLLRARSGVVEQRRAVGQRRVEEGREEVVAQVVVRTDVAARALERVAHVLRDGPVDQAPQRQQGLGHELAHPSRERHECLGEVGAGRGAPVAGHVPSPSPIFGMRLEAPVERLRADDLEHGRVGPAATDLGAVGVAQAHRHPGDGGVHDLPRDGATGQDAGQAERGGELEAGGVDGHLTLSRDSVRVEGGRAVGAARARCRAPG